MRATVSGIEMIVADSAGLGEDDRLIGGDGADYLDGGDGEDWVEYVDSAAGITVNLTTSIGAGGEGDGDTYFDRGRVRVDVRRHAHRRFQCQQVIWQ